MTKKINLTAEAALRMAKATAGFERLNKGGAREQTYSQAVVPQPIWAQITDCDRDNGYYSWKAIAPKDTGQGELELNGAWGSGDMNDTTGYAVEVGGSTQVLKNSFVLVYPAKSQPFVIFQYVGGVVKGTLTSDIPAFSDSPAKGTAVDVQIKSADGSGTDTDTVKCFNPYSVTIKQSDGATVTLGYDQQGGAWWVIGQDCSSSSSSGGCSCDSDLGDCGCDGDPGSECVCEGDTGCEGD
jgi:hypothetical protein